MGKRQCLVSQGLSIAVSASDTVYRRHYLKIRRHSVILYPVSFPGDYPNPCLFVSPALFECVCIHSGHYLFTRIGFAEYGC